MPHEIGRRDFLWTALQAPAAAGLARQRYEELTAPEPPPPPPKVAALFSEFRFRSHAYNILENFLGPRWFRGQRFAPAVQVVAFYADQFPENDMAREVSARFGIPLFDSIEEALCLGGSKLAVDAVLSIVEQGDYPMNERWQKLYPRKEFFDRSVAVMRDSRRFVPYFNDKHLSHSASEAATMYHVARQYTIPLMAGSSVPLAQRRPIRFELPPAPRFEQAVAIHGGNVESYDFHGLELLQSFVEARYGRETGIAQVQFLEGEQLLIASEQPSWPRESIAAALRAELGEAPDDLFGPLPGDPTPPPPHAIVVDYRDGLRAVVLKIGQNPNRWNFACRLRDEPEPRATALYNGPWGNRNLFAALSHAIQSFFVYRQPPYSPVRTLLAGAAVDAAMSSRLAGGDPISTSFLARGYSLRDFSEFRENGASWKFIKPDSPEPKEFLPGLPAKR